MVLDLEGRADSGHRARLPADRGRCGDRRRSARVHRARRPRRRRVRPDGAAPVRAPVRPRCGVPALVSPARPHAALGAIVARHPGGAHRRLQGADAQRRAARTMRARLHDQRHDPRRHARAALPPGARRLGPLDDAELRAPLHARARPGPHGHPVPRRDGAAEFVARALPGARTARLRRPGQPVPDGRAGAGCSRAARAGRGCRPRRRAGRVAGGELRLRAPGRRAARARAHRGAAARQPRARHRRLQGPVARARLRSGLPAAVDEPGRRARRVHQHVRHDRAEHAVLRRRQRPGAVAEVGTALDPVARRRPADRHRHARGRTRHPRALRPRELQRGDDDPRRGRRYRAAGRLRAAGARAGHAGRRLFARGRRIPEDRDDVIVEQIEAGWLPGLPADAVDRRTLRLGRGADAIEVRVPLLTPAQMTALAERVRRARAQVLARMPVAQVIDAVDRAVQRLLDPADPYRREADRLLPRASGFDPEMVRLGLNAYLRTFRAPQLARFVAEDFADPALLDAFRPRPNGGFARALGPGLLVHVWAGNVPALPLWSLVCGLLVKAGSIGKVSSAEPLFAGWFARVLAEVEPRLAESLAIVWWQGGDAAIERALFAEADVVLAYGGNDTLEALRQQVPAATRFLPHGHKLSFGVVSASALAVRLAQAAARQAALDVVRYEQHGCYSPQAFYVERGGAVSPLEFAQALAGELDALAHRWPRRALSLEAAASVAAWRQAREIDALRGEGDLMLGNAHGAWSVAYRDTAVALEPGALERTVQVFAVDRLAQIAACVAPRRGFLQTAGVATSPEELFALADQLAEAGVTRVCALGAMTSPTPGWHHDGRFSLLDLVRMVEVERSAELGAEACAPYRD